MSMLWFCCGIAISLRAGVYANVIADVLFLFLLVVPLVATRRVFLCPP
jgi:hypothetical protein